MDQLTSPPLLALAAVFLLIAVRQIGRFRLQIWQIMLAGAITVMLMRSISVGDALKAINVDVMLFLFGMFVVGEALHQSGYLYQLSDRLFGRSRTVDGLVLRILFSMGLLSAILMNDTLAIICTPLMIYFAQQHRIAPKLLLIALAFAITTGSVLSPIGNPQNLLVAVEGNVANPFVSFLIYLALPTIFNLALAYLALRMFYRSEFHTVALTHTAEPLADVQMANGCRWSLALIGALIALRVVASFVKLLPDFSLTWIAMLAIVPIMVMSRRRLTVIRRIDWSTLVFFAAMFVLMEAVWRTGAVQDVLARSGWRSDSVPGILGISLLVSQLISNVPFVALYLPMLQQTADPMVAKMALAAGSTIAGNLLILGAASNVIIIQNAEKQGETIGFWEFAKIGVPLTIVQIAVYWLYLSLF
ncbi:MAG: anion transporter [bacterium]|nr:anion transporter [bacterium]